MSHAPQIASRLARRTCGALIVACTVVGTVSGGAQASDSNKAPAPVAVTTTPAAAAPAVPQAPPQGYTYNPAGRRDPFVSLVLRGSEVSSGRSTRPEGLPGLTVDEVALRGIVQSRGAHVAMIQAPDGKSYTVRSGDKLFDGVVKAVTPSAVVFVQQVNDPLSLVKQREIRKPLRPTEEGK
jgi:type IV pilus assembly protein PilP